ncbi:hypothetical protein [Gemelliphila palaticanis]|uniref:Uncharacterized protein n=1 Tax=Gemelliphila palaticanis TaxID=81950 RepID=A0ABX2SZU2_9BACL|nr:hypothetical protein [Gemella palaticanis]MBF0715683.1 hypothetical protein [Gemella palaticanis]NYS47613.1 hypothetical protein [Gemella palaticanis]
MKNQELQNLVQLEIKNRESVSDIIGMNMMKRVLFELQHLEKNPQFQLTYSRMLVDCCDFNNDLVNKLLEYVYFIEKRK